MPFVHLPIQSGSNRILELMNRKHTVDDYLNIYEKLKKINKEIEFSSDFIIGYPGETQKDFDETFNLIKKIKFINCAGTSLKSGINAKSFFRLQATTIHKTPFLRDLEERTNAGLTKGK